jgi:hypothetical protein
MELKKGLGRELRAWLQEFGGTPRARAEWAAPLGRGVWGIGSGVGFARLTVDARTRALDRVVREAVSRETTQGQDVTMRRMSSHCPTRRSAR